MRFVTTGEIDSSDKKVGNAHLKLLSYPDFVCI